jgi:hypothetical protein
MVRFEVKCFEDCHIYVVVKSASSTILPRLIYPYRQDEDFAIAKGAVLVLPEKAAERAHAGSGKQSLSGVMIPGVQGREEVYMLAAKNSLFEAFNTHGADQIVADNLFAILQEVGHGQAITRPAGAIFHGMVSETQVFDPMEKINVLVLRLSHQR